jgi:hypothetical protein
LSQPHPEGRPTVNDRATCVSDAKVLRNKKFEAECIDEIDASNPRASASTAQRGKKVMQQNSDGSLQPQSMLLAATTQGHPLNVYEKQQGRENVFEHSL